MKIFSLEESPHKKGSSNLLAEQFIKGAEENGHSITVLDAAHMDMRPCLGCDHCGMNQEGSYRILEDVENEVCKFRKIRFKSVPHLYGVHGIWQCGYRSA